MTRIGQVLLFVLSAATLQVSVAESQVIERPPRVYRGLFGASPAATNRWRHELTMSGNTLFGQDENVSPAVGDGGGFGANGSGASGSMAFGGAQLLYGASRSETTIELAVRGFSNIYQGPDVQPVYGGGASTRISTPLGGRNTISAQAQYTDSPMYTPGVAIPQYAIDGPVDPASVPLAGLTTAYLLRRSQGADGGLTLQRRFSRRTTVSAGASHASSRYEDGIGDSDGTGAVVNYEQTLARPLESHSLTFNYSLNHRLTPSRRLAIAVGGGPTQVNTVSGVTSVPLSYRTPSGQANFRIDLTRSWNIGLDYSRSVSVVEGVTLDSFVNDMVSMQAGGKLGSRGDLAISGNYVTGQAGSEGPGTFESYTGTVQLQYAANRWMNTMISYTYYAYRLNNVITITPGLATNLDRSAIRAGLTFRLPLYGQSGSRGQGGSN
jgi:hypothetical protein